MAWLDGENTQQPEHRTELFITGLSVATITAGTIAAATITAENIPKDVTFERFPEVTHEGRAAAEELAKSLARVQEWS